MNFFYWFILQLAVMALTPTPKIPGAKRPEFDSLQVPTATEDRPLAYGVGPFRVAGNTVWYGDYRPYAVTEKVRVSLFKKQKVTKAWKLHIGLWQTLCVLPCDELREIRLGDKVVWSGSIFLSKDSITEVPVDLSWFAQEGQEVADGIKGKFLFFNHRVPDGTPYTPLLNDYMSSKLGAANVPGYPNTLHVVWLGPSFANNGFISLQNNIQPLSFTLYRQPDLSEILTEDRGGEWFDNYYDAQTVIDYFGDVSGDANIALVILELLATRMPGIGPRLSPWALDVDSFVRCAEQLQQENNGCAFTWEQSRPLADVVNDLLAQAAATIDIDPTTGRLAMRLIRSNELPKAVFTDSNIIEIESFTRQANTRPANEVQVPFLDRENNWIERVAVAQDPAGVRTAGSLITADKTFIGVTRAELASALADRELRIFASPLARVRFSAFNVAGLQVVLQPGDLIVFSHTPLGQNNLRLRVVSAKQADFRDRGRIEIEAVEDVFRDGVARASVTPLPQPDPSVPPVAVSGTAMAAPYALTGSDADRLLYIATDPGTSVDAYRVAIQEGTTSWRDDESEEYLEGTQEPAIAGSFTSTLAANATTATITLTAEAAQQWGGFRGSLLVIADSEWMECSNWSLDGTTLTATGIQRGIFDTVPASHSSGTGVLVLLGYSVDESTLKTKLTATSTPVAGIDKLVARADSVGAGGILYAKEASGSQVVWEYDGTPGRAFRPLPVAGVELGSVVGGFSGDALPSVARAGSMVVGWKYRNRLAQQLAPYYQTDSDQESGSQVAYVVEYLNGGSWVELASGTTAGNSVSFSTAGLPASDTEVRARLTTKRAGAESAEVVVSWIVSA